MDQSVLLKSDFTLTFFTSLVASQANRAPGTIKYLEFVPDAVTSPHSYESIHAHDQEGKESHHYWINRTRFHTYVGTSVTKATTQICRLCLETGHR